jgi:hypothetical protein
MAPGLKVKLLESQSKTKHLLDFDSNRKSVLGFWALASETVARESFRMSMVKNSR